MLNRFQFDILDYLDVTAEHFLSTLKDNETDVIIIDNIIAKLVSYLGSMIKRDLDLHDEQSEGYNRLEDMLIEIHIPLTPEFKAALMRTTLLPLRQAAVRELDS
jgi:hypothetical protein